ncbi:MAG TPA: ABC transporter permease [Vicinamibacterales bacterium]
MNALRLLLARIRSLVSRGGDPGSKDEVEEHIRLLTERYVRQGLAPGDAALAARRQFGNMTRLQEDWREQLTFVSLESLWRDLRLAGRSCRRSPGFSTAVVLTLALGIGANTALFSVCNAILLKPLPYDDPDRLVMLWERMAGADRGSVAPANFVDWRAQTRSFSGVAAINPFLAFVMSTADAPARVAGAAVSWNFFSVLGIRLASGRSFLPDEDQPDRNGVAILTHGLWMERFGGRPDIVGSTVTLNDRSFTVVGILPANFELVSGSVFQGRPQFDIWIPLALSSTPSRGSHPLRVFARLKSGVTLERAQTDVNSVAANLARAYPEDNKDHGISAVSLHEQVAGEVRPALITLSGAVGFVLLIACANVANLMLSRGTARQKEIAVRMAIGANRLRVARQLLIESAVLACVGGALGLLLAFAAVRLAAPYLPSDLSRATGFPLDARVLIFTALISLATGASFGLAPLVQMRRISASESLQHGTRIAGGSARLRSALVVAQMAVTMILLIGAGLLAKSLWTLLHVPPGFRADHVVSARITLPRSRYADTDRVSGFHRELIQRLQESSGIEAAGLTAYLPLSRLDNSWVFSIEGRPPLPIGVYNNAKYRPVSEGYFETIGMPMTRGRAFTSGDQANAPWVVVINESMARAYWGTENPVGQRLRFGSRPTGPDWRTIVGVVGDVRHEALDGDPKPELYVPFSQAPSTEPVASIVVRTSIDAAAMAKPLRDTVSAMDASVPLDQVRTMEEIVSMSVSQPRFRTALLMVFSALALLMASIGVYGTTSYSARQRTREFGVYIAMGANTRDVLRTVLGRATVVIVIGLALGVVASIGLTRLLTKFLYGVTPLDPTTFMAAPMFLFVVAIVACYLPARRATRVDPIVALRYE